MKHCVAFCSPHGSTRHVAEVIAARLAELGATVEMLDLGVAGKSPTERYGRIPAPKCLWVGSPVYVSHAVPLIQDFIETLQGGNDCYAVPFVTWGGVSSGTALADMAQGLARRSHTLLGGASVIAVHSVMWQSNRPLGTGHPDAEDDKMVRGLVDAVDQKLSSPHVEGIPMEALDYQPAAVKEESKLKSLVLARKHFPDFTCDVQRCTRCGECMEKCPAAAISMDPYPVFGEQCILCLTCVRICPEEAIPMDMTAMHERLRAMAETAGERAVTRIFV